MRNINRLHYLETFISKSLAKKSALHYVCMIDAMLSWIRFSVIHGCCDICFRWSTSNTCPHTCVWEPDLFQNINIETKLFLYGFKKITSVSTPYPPSTSQSYFKVLRLFFSKSPQSSFNILSKFPQKFPQSFVKG